MGYKKTQSCNNFTSRLWDFCINKLWVLAVHIQGKINAEADKLSRVL